MQQNTYFVSYTKDDEAWAKWISWLIEDNGHKANVQCWDINPGDDFVSKMNEFLINCNVFVPIVSSKYTESYWCGKEWANALVAEKEQNKPFIPIRIENYKITGLLSSKVYIDISDVLTSEEDATKRIIDGLFKAKERKGTFPGAAKNAGIKKPYEFPGNKTFDNPTNAPLNNLYPRYEYFTGREKELRDINTAFKDGKAVNFTQTIIGLGGVGKSQTALEYAHRHSCEYVDAIWWIHAENKTTIFNSFESFAKKAGLYLEQNLDADKLGAAIQNWQESNSSWLFIFDNVEDEDVIKPYISKNYKGHILFTSRRRELRGIYQSKTVDVDVLLPEDAKKLIRARLENDKKLIKNKTDLSELVERLGRFPLALEQAAAYIWRSQIDCRGYINKLEEKGLEPLTNKLGEPMTDYKHTVTTTFMLSYTALSEGARQLFNLCTYMAPDDMPIYFFKKQADTFPKPLCDDLSDEDALIAELYNYSLVKRTGDFLNMHRFVQEVGREQNKDDEHDWVYYCLEAAISVLPKIDVYSEKSVFVLFEQTVTHTEMIARYSGKFVADEQKAEKLGLLYQLIAAGYFNTAIYYKALEWHQKEKDVYEKVLGNEHQDTATTYNNMAVIFSKQGDYEKALEWHQKALAIRKKVLGNEHQYTATTYDNMAVDFSEQGDYEKALTYNQKALAILEKVLGTDHPNTAYTYSNMAVIFSKQGDYEKALTYHQKALVIREKVLGTDHPDTANTYNNMAVIFSEQGGYEKALMYNQKALVIHEKVLGTDHPDTAHTYSNMAVDFSEQSDYEKALTYNQKALVIRQKVLGNDHPDTADTYNNMAVIFSNQGDYINALEWHQKALDIHEKVLGKDHPDTAISYSNMAVVFSEQGYNEKALEWHQKALDIREKVLGKDHPDTITSRNNIKIVRERMQTPPTQTPQLQIETQQDLPSGKKKKKKPWSIIKTK